MKGRSPVQDAMPGLEELKRLQKVLADAPVPTDGRMSWPHSFTGDWSEVLAKVKDDYRKR